MRRDALPGERIHTGDKYKGYELNPYLMRGETRAAFADRIALTVPALRPGETTDLEIHGIKLRVSGTGYKDPEKRERQAEEKERVGTWKRGLPNGKTARSRKYKATRQKAG